MTDIILLIALAGIIICIADVIGHAADYFGREKVKPHERKTKPFTSRHLKPEEIAHLLHQLNIMDAIHPITPASYHDATQVHLEELISDRLGYKFQLSAQDWFHIMRAWYVTRGQDSAERIERLDLRLKLNI